MSILDTLALNYGNVVLRDGNNKPSIFVKHPKQNSIDFDPSLPDHVHPAFLCGAEVEDDAVLIGKYKNSEYEINGPLYSIPNGNTTAASDATASRPRTYDNCLSSIRAFGGNVTGMTIADHGLLVLMAHKSGLALHGNTSFCVDANDGTSLVSGMACALNSKYCFKGWEYKCVKAIDSLTADLIPDKAPAYWEKIRKVGGTSNGTVMADGIRYSRTLTGSGPVDWYLNHDLALEADLVGISAENVYGMRIKNGEIQIIPNNLSADPTSDHTVNSSLWRAIKPTGSGACEYVAINSDEANTLHYAPVNNKVTLVKRALTSAELSAGNKEVVFKDMTVETSSIALADVPIIMYELGLFPIAGTTVNGLVRVTFDAGEHVPRTGDSPDTRNKNAGIASLLFQYTRAAAIGSLTGSRARVRVPAEA